MSNISPTNLPATLDVPDVFQPRKVIDRHNEELALLYKELCWIASGRQGTWHPEVYISGVEDNELTHPTAEFVAVADNNPSGSNVTFKGASFEFMGYAPVINCNVYRNPNATVKLYDTNPLKVVEPVQELSSPEPTPVVTPTPVSATIPSIKQNEDEESN